MRSPPFHRRILPWVFALTFLIAAPALVFYTSGYRWNAKKAKIERNGTLIIDSRPTKASIFLNGKNNNETTPITLQNVTPGNYTIKIQKNGYHSWEKRLDVYPELVTFVNEVRLWKDVQPLEDDFQGVFRIDAAPDEKNLALLKMNGASGTLIIWTPESGAQKIIEFSHSSNPDTIFSWSPDSRYLLLQDEKAGENSHWLINPRTDGDPIELPKGTYRWNGSILEGTTDGNAITINPANGSISRQPYTKGIEDIFSGLVLRYATGTDSLVLFHENIPERGLILPSGDWRVYSSERNGLILRDGINWLNLNAEAEVPEINRLTGDKLRPFNDGNEISYLAINGGELWLWNVNGDSELLLRESQPISDAVWHSAGSDVAFALNGGVFMLNLDKRNNRIRTQLAEFDKVYDLALLKKKLYISASLNNRSGIWELEIE